MLDKIKRALSNQFHIDNLELQYESPNDFLFGANKGHIIVEKGSMKVVSTVSGFLSILIIENNILI